MNHLTRQFGKTSVLFFIILLGVNLRCENLRGAGPDRFCFQVSFSPAVHPQPITGRIYVIISRNNYREPRFQVGPTGVPFWGKNISGLKPGEFVTIDSSVFGYPLTSIYEIPTGEYYVQAFVNIYTEFHRADGHTLWMHNDQWEGQHWNRSPYNLYSKIQKIRIDPATSGTIRLICDQMIPPVKVPPDTKWVKRIQLKSELLSRFWGQPIYLGATILLPKGYSSHSETYYPVNYIQGHFSLRPPYGFFENAGAQKKLRARRDADLSQFWMSDSCPRILAVTFQHPCPFYDDSYAVNSANLGPYGDAIIKELIPRVEEEFRIIKKPYARILSGGSTGGWIALALQIFYPEFFGGTFASCPDPVDFRSYQLVNIYNDKNAYYTRFEWLQIERPNQRSTDGSIRSTIRNENLYELVVGDRNRSGGQWDIWEAAFSPIGEDGYPRRLWDKRTGKINPEVAQQWQRWDLRWYLEQNWSWLGPKLVGKLHIYVGDMDSFYLNNGVVRLEKFLNNTKNPYYSGTVEYGDRKPHCWGPRGIQLIRLIDEYVTKNAPEPGEVKKWHY